MWQFSCKQRKLHLEQANTVEQYKESLVTFTCPLIVRTSVLFTPFCFSSIQQRSQQVHQDVKKMLFMLLFMMLCLLDTSRTKQFRPGDDYLQIVGEFYRPLSAATASARRPSGASRLKVGERHQLAAPVSSQMSTTRYQVPPASLAASAGAQPSYEAKKQTPSSLAQHSLLRPARGDANQQPTWRKQASSPTKLTRFNRNVNSHKQSIRDLKNMPQHHQQQRRQHNEHEKQLQQERASATNSPDRDANQGQLTVNQARYHEQKNKLMGVEKFANDREAGLVATPSSTSAGPASVSLASISNDVNENGDTVAMASSSSGALSSGAPPSKSLTEDPVLSAQTLDSSLAESLDFVGNDLGGHFDYAYQPLGREPAFTVAAASQQQTSAANNSTMALYRLLNLIEQSARPQTPLHLTQPPISMPFQGSKISSPYISYAPISSSLVRVAPASSQANFDSYNDYHYHTLAAANKSLFNGNHLFNNLTRDASYVPYPFASQQPYERPAHHSRYQSSPSFMPNHWSRKRNQLHQDWRQQADLNHRHAFSSNSPAALKQEQQQQLPSSSLFVDQNSIEVQPAAMKMIKPSHSFGPPRRNNSHYSHDYERPSGGAHGGGHQNLSLAAPTVGSANQNNLDTLNNNFNSLLNNADIGFGNKQPPAAQVHQPAQPPNNSFGQQAPGSANGAGQPGEKLSGALTSSSLANSKVPHDADSEMIAANNAPRCDKFTPDICVDDFEYPEQAIIDEIQKKRDVFELMYSEVKDNESMVDGIPRDVEESYNYDYYYYGKTNLSQAASQPGPSQTTPSPTVGAGLRLTPLSSFNMRRSSSTSTSDTLDGSLTARATSPAIVAAPAGIDGMDALIGAMPQATNPQASQSPPTTGYICPSEVMYGKPKLAKNKKGLWKVIVNAGEFTQTVRLEKCLFPNKKCNYVSAQSYESRCAQVHSYHRLLVFEKGRGFYIDTFRLPTGCNCFVSRKPFASSGSSVSSASNRRDSTSSRDSTGGQSDGPSHNRVSGRLPPLLDDSSSSSGANNGGQRESSSSSRGPSSESMLSQTLWSILSGGGSVGGGSLPLATANGSPQQNLNSFHNYESASSDNAGGQGTSGANYNPSTWQDGAQTAPLDGPSSQREAYQSQSLILEHLSQNPSLAANISDSVLRQLIDVGQISGGGGASGSPLAGSQHHQQRNAHTAYPPHHSHEHYHYNHHQYQSQQNRPPPYRRRRSPTRE